MNATNIYDILTQAQIDACSAPIEQARTLPRQAFTSDRFFELEAEKIFARQWAALCFVQQVENPGDVLPIDLCGMPLLVVRGNDKQVRVFHNIVPYDGCLAAIDPAGESSEIVTPYHGWRYDLQGRLKATPIWNGTWSAEPADLNGHAGNLTEIQCEIWGPVVFVNVTGGGGSFDEYIDPLRRGLEQWRVDEMDIARDAQRNPLLDPEDLQTNWKTHYENWGINVLHESFVHHIYDQSPEVPRLDTAHNKTCEDHIDGDFMALRFEAASFPETYSLPAIPHLGLTPDAPPSLGYFGSLFPNLHIGALGPMIHLIIGQPVSPGRTKTLRAQFYDAEVACSEDLLEMRTELMGGLRQAGDEDARITQAVQRARRSPVFDSQFYSPFWDAMHHRFTRQIINTLAME